MADSRASRIAGPVGLALAAIAAATTITHPFEGTVQHTYPDVVYHWALPTACRGHTGTFHGAPLEPGQTFTLAECDEMEAADLTKTYDALAPCFGGASMNANELGAYLSLGYNIGAGAVCRSSIPRKVKAGNHAGACDTILEFHNAGGKDCRIASSNCQGIPRRRVAERSLCVRPPT
jgi:lysozyme